jgi:hypothetical protein
VDEKSGDADVENGQDTDYPHASLLRVEPNLLARLAQRRSLYRFVTWIDGTSRETDLAGVSVAATGALGQDEARFAILIRVDQDQHSRGTA